MRAEWLLLILVLIVGCAPAEKGVDMAKGNVLLIVAQRDFQPMEYKDTRAELEKAGFKIEVASITTNDAVGADGSQIKPDIAVRDAIVENYKAVVLIGGPGALSLGNYSEVTNLLKSAESAGKVIGAICISPVILAKAGILEGKRATVWTSVADKSAINFIEGYGADYVNEAVVADGKIITANGPAAAKSFGKKIAEVIGNA